MGETPFPNHAAALKYAELNGLNLVWAGTMAFEKWQRALSPDQFQVRPVRTRKGITMAGLFSKEITRAEWEETDWAWNVTDEVYLVCIAHHYCGGKTIDLGSAEELARYNSDPDGWAAAYYGLTREQYHEWVALEGRALCGHAGCDNRVPGRMAHDADRWKQVHRHAGCRYHGGLPDPEKARLDASRKWLEERKSDRP